MKNLVTAKEVMKILRISPQTMYNWRKSGKLKYHKVANKTYLYDITDITHSVNQTKHVIYSRVSSTAQADDLKRQSQLMRSFVTAKGIIPDEVIEDIGSGMNFNRRGFEQLLSLVQSGEVDTVYITYKDRLCRFGFELVQKVFESHGAKIIAINGTTEEEFQQELTADLVAIIHHFSMKLYSNRRKELKSIAKLLSDTK